MRTREYIEKGESEGKSLIDAMEQGDQDGMQTFDGVIEQMVRSGVLTQEAAMPYATNAGNLLLRLGDLGRLSSARKGRSKKTIRCLI